MTSFFPDVIVANYHHLAILECNWLRIRRGTTLRLLTISFEMRMQRASNIQGSMPMPLKRHIVHACPHHSTDKNSMTLVICEVSTRTLDQAAACRLPVYNTGKPGLPSIALVPVSVIAVHPSSAASWSLYTPLSQLILCRLFTPWPSDGPLRFVICS